MIELQVSGMTCGGCVNAVKRIVAKVDASAQVDVDLSSKRVSIASALPSTEFAAALNLGGYPANAPEPAAAAAGGCCGNARG